MLSKFSCQSIYLQPNYYCTNGWSQNWNSIRFRTVKERVRDCQLPGLNIEHYHSFKFIYDFNNNMESISITGSLSLSSFHSFILFKKQIVCLVSPLAPSYQLFRYWIHEWKVCQCVMRYINAFLASEIIIVVDKTFWIVLLKIPLVHIAFYPFYPISLAHWHIDLYIRKRKKQ